METPENSLQSTKGILYIPSEEHVQWMCPIIISIQKISWQNKVNDWFDEIYKICKKEKSKRKEKENIVTEFFFFLNIAQNFQEILFTLNEPFLFLKLKM